MNFFGGLEELSPGPVNHESALKRASLLIRKVLKYEQINTLKLKINFIFKEFVEFIVIIFKFFIYTNEFKFRYFLIMFVYSFYPIR